MKLLRLWNDKSIFDYKLIVGWTATLKLQPKNYYSLNLHDAAFVPEKAETRKLIEKVKNIMMPGLKAKFKYY